MVIEPVLGEGGYIPAPGAFLRGIAEICAEHGILFVADEVQTRLRPHRAHVRHRAQRRASPTSSSWPRASRRASRCRPSARRPS